MNDHVEYYRQISNIFGNLSNQIYHLVEETPNKLIVHLIKKDQNINNLVINPEDIIQVEIYLSEINPKYMEKGLGLSYIPFEDKEDNQITPTNS